jgi:3-phenylpropionate/cinnamic acid dioxygenase small subunit
VISANDTAISDVVLQYELEQALYDEAEALDERRYRDWLACLTDDVTYWMPIRSTRSQAEVDDEFTKPGEGALFDEDRRMLEARVYKLETGYAWAEDPPSRTRHTVTNVRVKEKHSPSEVTVSCNFMLYRSRLDVDEDLWVGRRLDRLRKIDGRWKIARREIYLDQTVLKAKNLSTFF